MQEQEISPDGAGLEPAASVGVSSTPPALSKDGIGGAGKGEGGSRAMLPVSVASIMAALPTLVEQMMSAGMGLWRYDYGRAYGGG